ncbi:MAG TPA: ABC transporter permease [candidate division WOR-3 bacterium]|uniref:Transport permease protein n=1 Tax=candidate division WOR-3 bacterium TaxID=2052148 RepID=A0A9C9JZV3_UNCW3|nr:ABC transporter permease [candidate division WOR-3 bacterium]
MTKLLKIIRIELMLFIRQRESVFYTLAFPFICLLLFAGIWGKFPGYINTLTSGLTGMIALNIAVFGAGLVLNFYRQHGFYKRLTISPVSELIYLSGLIISRFIILFVVANLFMLFSYTVFGFRIKGNIFEVNLILFIGTLSLAALAVFLVSLGRTQSQTIQTANLLFFPMLFLGGTFYSIDHLPQFLKIIAHVFPYTYLNKGLSNIIIRGTPFFQNITELGILLFWLILCLSLAVKRFKKEEVL